MHNTYVAATVKLLLTVAVVAMRQLLVCQFRSEGGGGSSKMRLKGVICCGPDRIATYSCACAPVYMSGVESCQHIIKINIICHTNRCHTVAAAKRIRETFKKNWKSKRFGEKWVQRSRADTSARRKSQSGRQGADSEWMCVILQEHEDGRLDWPQRDSRIFFVIFRFFLCLGFIIIPL